MRESEIEAHLVRRVKGAFGMVRKVAWIGVRGAPDRLVLLPGVGDLPAQQIWVELKAPGKVAEPHQKREHARLRHFGLRVVVIDSKAGVDALFA